MPSTISAGTTAGTAIAIAGDTTGNLAFQTNGTTTAMTITTAQNVGIGTNNPQSLLEVAGQMSASPIWIRSGGASSTLFYDGSLSVSRTGVGPQFGVDSSGNFQFASGYGSVATAYGCRAWVNFNGTGTVAIRASGNVSSITDNGTGWYTVNFTTAMPNANYAVAGSADRVFGTRQCVLATQGGSFGINSFAIYTLNDGTTLADSTDIGVIVLR